MSLNNTADDYEIASQITMIIEHYVHGHENRLLVFCNSEHISDKLMAINHSNILNILDIRFPQCFTYLIQPSIINAITPNGNTSDDSIFSSDQVNHTSNLVISKIMFIFFSLTSQQTIF